MSNVTRRLLIRAGVAAGATFIAGTTSAGSEPEKSSPVLDALLPGQMTNEDIQAAKDGSFTKLEFAGTTFWLRSINLGYGVPHTLIGIYAPARDGLFHRSLSAESWRAGNMEATVEVKTGILELRERANSNLRGQLVLSCNLKAIGTQHSIRAK